MAIINGRRMNIPDSGIYGQKLIDRVNPDKGRRAVVRAKGTNFETINPFKHYGKGELLDRRGNPVKVTTIPERFKGISYDGLRSHISKKIITEQVIDIAEHYLKGGVDFDEIGANWMIAPRYRLPEIWHSEAKFSPVLIVFPTEYPEIPPIGFYMKAEIGLSPNGHLFDTAYHQAYKDPLNQGWKWYCVYIESGLLAPVELSLPR